MIAPTVKNILKMFVFFLFLCKNFTTNSAAGLRELANIKVQITYMINGCQIFSKDVCFILLNFFT